MKLKEAKREFIAELKGHPKTKQLTFIEGVAMIVGTNIGIGILSLAHTAKYAGFFPLLFWLVIGGVLAAITMLYVAEATLRTKDHLQLTGLSVKYIGPLAKYIMFLSVAVTAIGALIAYETASGNLIYEISKKLLEYESTRSIFFFIPEGGIPKMWGSFLFFIPASGVLWLGLKAIGRGEKQVIGIMFAILVMLIVASFFKHHIDFENLNEMHWDWAAIIPIFNTVVFVFTAQYIVPEIARGFSHKPEMLPKAIILGTFIVFCLCALIPLCAIALEGLKNISGVVTISWGKAIGEWAFIIANCFALFAILTSYWGLGGMFLANIADQFNQDIENNLFMRFLILIAVVVPPLLIVYFGWVDSIDEALYWPGVMGALVLSCFPILILRNARKHGDKETNWQCPALLTHGITKAIIVFVYVSATVLGVLVKYGIVKL